MAETTPEFLLPNPETAETQAEPVISSPKTVGRFNRMFRALVASAMLAIPLAEASKAGDPAVSPTVEADENVGPLFIGGGSITSTLRKRYLDLAGGRDARIVIIHTAHKDANDPEQQASFLWKEYETCYTQPVFFHVNAWENPDEKDLSVFDNATGVWFSGGWQSELTKRYLNTRVPGKIREVNRKKGVVIGGSSAGAAIMSGTMIERSETDHITGKLRPVITDGFDFLKGTIVDQHYLARQRQERLKNAREQHPHLVGVGIDEDTALIVRNNIFEVVGTSTVSVYPPDGSEHVLHNDDTREIQTFGMPPMHPPAAQPKTVAMP